MNANPQLQPSQYSKSPAGNKMVPSQKELLPLQWGNCSLTQSLSCGSNSHMPLLIQKWQGAQRATPLHIKDTDFLGQKQL